VLDKVYARNFAPESEGMYFMDQAPPAILFRFFEFVAGNFSPLNSQSGIGNEEG